MKKGLLERSSIGSRAFDIINALFLLIFGITCLLPFLFVLAASLSTESELIKHDFIIFPVGFTLENYKYVLTDDPSIPRALFVSVFITVVGTLLNLVLTSLTAYPLAHSRLFGRKIVMMLVTFTLVFSGGMIPTYILVQKLHLLDTYWSVLLPGSVSAFNLIVFISFFRSIPAELEEAAKIDGYNDLSILFRIILPLSKPLLATFTLMFAVGHWNSWFDFVLYISNSKMWPIQVVLRDVLATSSTSTSLIVNDISTYVPPTYIMSYCIIIISTVPILCVYPFLQKYFAKGIMIGSVKG